MPRMLTVFGSLSSVINWMRTVWPRITGVTWDSWRQPWGS